MAATTFRRASLALVFALLPTLGPAFGQQGESGAQPAYLNPALPIEQRVDDLVSRMTLLEKSTQMINNAAAIPRLQVPAYNWWSEALHGVARAGIATVFPQVIGMAATWDAPLIHGMADVTSTEARAKFHQRQRQIAAGQTLAGAGLSGLDFWAPNINIFRDPRWGRGHETYGEDPFLTSQMAMAYVSGMQGADPKYFKTIATPKHFAVHSGPETTRHTADAKVSLHDMEDTYLPAFRATLVDAKADSVMCAYNRINGQPACANDFLLKDTLREAWKFNGYVVSDCGAISDIFRPEPSGHGFTKSLAEAAAVSMKKGTDNDCALPTPDNAAYLEAVTSGLISEKELDVNLKRTLKARFQLGLFDPPEMVSYARIPFAENDTEQHRALALKVADESMVLLKNDGVLPLKPGTKNIAVVGPLADSMVVLLGNYNGTPSRYATVLDGIRKQFPSANVTFTPGTTFLRGPVLVPETALRTNEGKPGLTAAYFGNKDLSGAPAVTRVEPQLGISRSVSIGEPGAAVAGTPLPSEVATGDVSARWTGAIAAPETGAYSLTVNGSGGVRVWLDNKQIMDEWRDSAPAAPQPRTAQVTLEKGKSYGLKVEFFHAASQTPQGARGSGSAAGAAGPSLVWENISVNTVQAALDAAKAADVVVAVVGLTAELEGEEMARANMPEGFKGGDRTTIDLPRDEQALIEALKTTGKPLVIVLMAGSSVAVNWAKANANAILDAWYPGEEGGAAVARTLAGVNNPAGRLPVTFYKSVNDLPPFEDYGMKGRTYRYFEGEPLYPFGYGLSYSKFAYTNVKATPGALKAGNPLVMEADIRNTSAIAGAEVAQLYVQFPNVPGAPLRALRGFQRVNIPAGQTVHVRFTLNPRDLSMVNEAGDRLVAAGAYRIFIGGGQPGTSAAGMEVALTVQGESKLPR